ncbi:unnamed protein product [Lupinus luteus]|uniref:F-box domain-containing protein n=1 Tax=Lupinus luteus TaxID=3873 RepID=A0AAV1VQE8_LUPLU
MATIVASMEYLVTEILLRLPVKSVLKFKCVSKQWFALISDPKFCHSHTLRLYRTSQLFPSALLLAPVDSSTCQIISLKSINASDSSKFRNVKVPMGTVIQSCNGLLLIERISSEDFSEVDYFISNPTTNKSVPVIFPTQQFSSSVLSLFICFEPMKSLHYKLVSIRVKNYISFSDMSDIVIPTNIIDTEYVINVYSSETSSWSEPGFTFTCHGYKPPIRTNTVYFNGSLYWHNDGLRKFYYFDLDSQILKTCPTPLNMDDNGISKFCESGGHLYFVHKPVSEFMLYIMELKEESSEWALRFHLKLRESRFQLLLCFPYCVVKQENDEESMLLNCLNEKVLFYNLGDAKFRDLNTHCPFLVIESCSLVYQYHENLSCIAPTQKICKLQVLFCFHIFCCYAN